jgi:hypothetical protein
VFGGNFRMLMNAMITIGPRNRTISRVTGANRMPSAPRPDPCLRDGFAGAIATSATDI